MKTSFCRAMLALILSGGFLAQGHAELKSAKVSDYKGLVTISSGAGARQVQVDSKVTSSDVLRTGTKSLAELVFNDNTLTRLGANTIFSYSPQNREFEVQSGTMLLQVPPGLGGAKIQTAAVTAGITGTTVMVQKLPNGVVKLMVLEGSMTATLKGSNRVQTLGAGQMLVVLPTATSLPPPVVINVATVVGTSKLVQGFKANLTSEAKINKTIARQKELTKNGGLKAGGVEITTTENLLTVLETKVPTAPTNALTNAVDREFQYQSSQSQYSYYP